jgi:hypothetical protein
MRILILLGIFAAMSVCAGAAERLTVEQLEQKLAALVASPQPAPSATSQMAGDADLLVELSQDLGKFGLDADRAAQIDAFELTERLTAPTLARLAAKFQPGPQIRLALEQLADRSALLDPPASELPRIAPPDAESRRKMVNSAVVFVIQVLSHLPNFFAVRTTARFDNATMAFNGSLIAFPPGMHLVGRSSRGITFRDGKEVIDPMRSDFLMAGIPEMGLASQGEFGPELAIVLFDLVKGTLTFHHWEQTPAGLAAVFHYSVPRESSHYQVNYNCQTKVTFNDSPGYHGSLAIDPATGAIFRITLEADSKNGDPISHIASVIEYAPVEIGGRSYVCPVRSLAFMVEDSNACMHHLRKERLMQPVTMLNQTNFTDYHRLGSSATIIPDPAQPPDPGQVAPNP